jgi:hypothetical protein
MPSIFEALRTVCNLALAPNTMLIESKIPEMLGILLKHANPDAVLLSLQALANLINHAGVRRRFRDGGFVAVVLGLLTAEEVDELELEAIAALVMNFGAISEDEAQLFARSLEEYEIGGTNGIVNGFVDFLNGQM